MTQFWDHDLKNQYHKTYEILNILFRQTHEIDAELSTYSLQKQSENILVNEFGYDIYFSSFFIDL